MFPRSHAHSFKLHTENCKRAAKKVLYTADIFLIGYIFSACVPRLGANCVYVYYV